MKLIHQNGERLFVTSLEISNHFARQHKSVLRAIRELDCSDKFRRRNFAPSSYHNDQDKTQSMYEITRDGFVFLCMGFTGEQAALWKERYIQAFNDMESALRASPDLAAIKAERDAIKEERDTLRAIFLLQTPFWAEAIRYRSMGLTSKEVGKLIGKSEGGVKWLYKAIRAQGLLPPAPKASRPSIQALLDLGASA